MSDFIVLGLVPGTQMQITFFAWLIAACSITTYIVLRASYRTQTFRAWLIASTIMVTVQRRQF